MAPDTKIYQGYPLVQPQKDGASNTIPELKMCPTTSCKAWQRPVINSTDVLYSQHKFCGICNSVLVVMVPRAIRSDQPHPQEAARKRKADDMEWIPEPADTSVKKLRSAAQEEADQEPVDTLPDAAPKIEANIRNGSSAPVLYRKQTPIEGKYCLRCHGIGHSHRDCKRQQVYGDADFNVWFYAKVPGVQNSSRDLHRSRSESEQQHGERGTFPFKSANTLVELLGHLFLFCSQTWQVFGNLIIHRDYKLRLFEANSKLQEKIFSAEQISTWRTGYISANIATDELQRRISDHIETLVVNAILEVCPKRQAHHNQDHHLLLCCADLMKVDKALEKWQRDLIDNFTKLVKDSYVAYDHQLAEIEKNQFAPYTGYSVSPDQRIWLRFATSYARGTLSSNNGYYLPRFEDSTTSNMSPLNEHWRLDQDIN